MFQKLEEDDLIEKELADKLSNMAKFRNLLVHQYTKIDDKKVYEILQKISKTLKNSLKKSKKSSKSKICHFPSFFKTLLTKFSGLSSLTISLPDLPIFFKFFRTLQKDPESFQL